MAIVDTFRLKTRLSDSGMPETEAQILVEELDKTLSAAIAAQVAAKADVVEMRAAVKAIHQRIEQVDKRFDDMNQRFNDVNQRLNDLNQGLEQVRSWWVMGLFAFIAFVFLGLILKDLVFK